MTELLSKIFVKNHKDTQNEGVRKSYGTLASFVGITVNLILALTKLVLGIFTVSAAVVADALNNFSDAGSSIITLVSFRMSAKPADRDHPFGHARIEYIASMVVSLLILFVGFETLTTSLSVLLGFSEVNLPTFSTVSIIIISISIFLKLCLALFYRTVGKKIKSGVIRAASVDSLTDCVSTTAVLVSAIIIKLTGWPIIDSIVSIALAIMIIIAGIKILNETKNSLLGEAPVQEQINEIDRIIADFPEVIGVHDLMIHNYGPSHYIASLHAEVDGAKDIYMLHDEIDNLEKRIRNELNIICTIHMDPIVTDDETVNDLKSFLQEVIREDFSDGFTFHDFRVVVGATHTNLIFDIVLPFEYKEKDENVILKVSEAVLKRRENCYCVITVDRG